MYIFYLLKVLEEIKVSKKMDRDTLINVARTSLRTKLHPELADLLTEVINKSLALAWIINLSKINWFLAYPKWHLTRTHTG